MKNITTSKTLEIKCEGAAYVGLDELTEFQGDLKSLSKDNYKRLKTEILQTGIAFPLRVWPYKKKTYIIGGHQTFRTLKRMRDKEGFRVPKIPVSWIQAANRKEARRRVLQDVSQYGKVERQGLYKFMHDSDLQMEELMERFDIPEIDLEIFKKEYFDDSGLSDERKKSGSQSQKSKKTRSKKGDKYRLGNHYLICGSRDLNVCDLLVSRYVEYTGNRTIIRNGLTIDWE